VPDRVRLVIVLVALLGLAGAPAGQSAHPATPPLTLSVNLSGSLEVVLGNATRIRTSTAPGAVIPPGPYLAIVSSDLLDSQDVFHMFHLSGPGVNVSSELLPCENPMPLLTVTLQPSSTYVYEDSRHPDLTHVVFSTSAAGSSSDTAGTAGSPATGKTTGSFANSSIAGSANAPFRGTLTGAVSSNGTPTLNRNGKRVSSLKTGRYTFAIDDKARTGGFAIARPGKQPVAVTGSAFVGKRTATYFLKAGQWMYYSSTGSKHRFVVVA
jgi:hypothetical protein